MDFEERYHELAKLAGSLAHEIKNPLSVIRMNMELLGEELNAKGVAVVVEASHSCMSIRGVRKPGSLCVTSAMKGIFRSNLSSRSEIMQLIYGVSSNAWLLFLWLGPVVWIGIAGFEELWRVFVLRRLWSVFNNSGGRWMVLLFISTLVGAMWK